MLEDEVDIQKALERKESMQKKDTLDRAAKERSKKPSASLKVYFSIEKMQLILKKEGVPDENGIVRADDFM